MLAATRPVQRPVGAKLLAVDSQGNFQHRSRSEFADLLHPGDLVIANDAATMPGSLQGWHLPSGRPVEIRLAGRRSLQPEEVRSFSAVLFGEGDFHSRTEDRPAPPAVAAGDQFQLGPLRARAEKLLNHPRLLQIEFEGSPDQVWDGLARHGRPIQYSHLPTPLALWDVWTPIAGPPVAFEPPSAGFAIDWRMLQALRNRRIEFAAITHAAGVSSTGDPALDARLPLDEPYRIPCSTALAIGRVRARRGRVIAVGTTVVRALEHAAALDGTVPAGEGLATQRISRATRLKVVDAILSGTHEPGTSHYDLLLAFLDQPTLLKVDHELNARDYRTHEFGDSILIASLR